MYEFDVLEGLQEKLKKISKKDKILHKRILKKIKEIINSENIEHYKNLRQGLKEHKRVHIGHFVLIFRFDKLNNFIIFDDFDPHNKIYLK